MSTAYSSNDPTPGTGGGHSLDPGLTRRYWLTLFGAAVIALAMVGVLLAAGVVPPERTEMVVHYYLITWVLFCIVFLYASLRHWATVDIPALPGRQSGGATGGPGSPGSAARSPGRCSPVCSRRSSSSPRPVSPGSRTICGCRSSGCSPSPGPGG
ncbi:hypothetical protein QP028_00460 [Corynebacterium suedekumii]|nr:hypothetical protein QP028_00460 [Corynebacterium suedekumii]